MSATAVIQSQTTRGDAKRTTNLIAGDAAYPTGGYTFTPQALGFFSRIQDIIRCAAALLAGSAFDPVITPTYDASGDGSISQLQFQLVGRGTAAEVASGTNVSAASYYLVVEGN
jgi:hypothetical protein